MCREIGVSNPNPKTEAVVEIISPTDQTIMLWLGINSTIIKTTTTVINVGNLGIFPGIVGFLGDRCR